MYHLKQFDAFRVSSRTAVTLYARAFRKRNNRRIGHIKEITIFEDPRSPFIHHFPFSMPGCYLPDVTQLHLYHLDWMITRPHDCFFDFLTLYSGVTELHLFSCRFKHASELRRLINALPRLETLKLSAIDGSTLCDIPTTAVSRPTLKANQNLQEIILHDSTRDMGLSTLMDSRVAIRNIIAFCTQYSSISRLTLKHGFLNSPACFLQLLRNLPPLSSLKVDGSFAYLDNSEWHGFQLEQADIGALHRLTRRCFSTFSLERILTTPALHLMKLISTPEACSQLVSLTVKHGDGTGPVAQLLQAVMDTLRLAGTALSEFIFVWDCDPGLSLDPLQDSQDLISVTVCQTCWRGASWNWTLLRTPP